MKSQKMNPIEVENAIARGSVTINKAITMGRLHRNRVAAMEAYYAAQNKYQPIYDMAVKAAQEALDEALEPTRHAYYAALDTMESET